MPRNINVCKRPPISIKNLALVVEAVHKRLAVELHHFKTLHTKPFRDILMITREVVMNNSSIAVNVQYGLYSQQKNKANWYIIQ